jgi:SAM-dependent MidA family methyltransferase
VTLTGDDFASITENTALVRELRERIAREGMISFRDFMDTVLYHPLHGYYRAGGASSRDYVTSPQVHPVFGALVGRQLHQLWVVMGQPARFYIVEQGAGDGRLARDIRRWAHDRAREFGAAMRYIIVEPAPELRAAQKHTLTEVGDHLDDVNWSDTLPDSIEGCVLSNELLDAFPVHRVFRHGDELLEVYVALEGERFVDRFAAPSTPEIARYFEVLDLLPGDECYAEVNLDAPYWIAHVATALRRGYVLTFDYGYEADQLYAPWRRDGTLLCSYRQSASSDPYQRLGRQDMTASVDFTTLRCSGARSGLALAGSTDQGSFLSRLGLGRGVAASGGQLEEYFARRDVMLRLIDPAGLGRIRVLLMAKGVPDARLDGFYDA